MRDIMSPRSWVRARTASSGRNLFLLFCSGIPSLHVPSEIPCSVRILRPPGVVNHKLISGCSAATNVQTGEGVAIKKVTNVFSKKILAKRALREIKLLQHFRGKCSLMPFICARD